MIHKTINDALEAVPDDKARGAPPFKKQRTVSDATAARADAGPSELDPYGVSTWSPRAAYLISKLRVYQIIDDSTPQYIIRHLAKIADKLFIYAGFGNTGDAVALLKRMNVGHAIIDQVLAADYSDLSFNCSEQNERENKEIYWTFAAAFVICFYEVKAKKQFCIQYFHPSMLSAEFLKIYEQFKDQSSLLNAKMLTFHLCMQIGMSAFGRSVESDSDKARLIELCTRICEGRELAFACGKPSVVSAQPSLLCIEPSELHRCREIIYSKVLDMKKNPVNYRVVRDNKVSRSVHFEAAEPAMAADTESTSLADRREVERVEEGSDANESKIH